MVRQQQGVPRVLLWAGCGQTFWGPGGKRSGGARCQRGWGPALCFWEGRSAVGCQPQAGPQPVMLAGPSHLLQAAHIPPSHEAQAPAPRVPAA